ncbi:MAG: CopG family transcriptional regulator [Prochlorococcaceae cyanobacterium]
MTMISLKLPDGLAAQLADQARRSQLSQSELIRRALLAYLQAPAALSAATQPSAADLVADLVGCCDSAPADLSFNPAYLAGFGER